MEDGELEDLGQPEKGDPEWVTTRRTPAALQGGRREGGLDVERVVFMGSPSGHARVFLGRNLYPWQAAVLDSMAPEGSRTALVTCNESGKTSEVITDLCIWHMRCHPGSLTITTAGVYRQVIGQLYPAIRSRLSGMSGWNITTDRIDGPGGSVMRSFATRDSGMAEGWHSPPRETGKNPFPAGWRPMFVNGKLDPGFIPHNRTSLLIVADEAKSIPRGIFEAFERCHPDRFLIASSPGEPIGYFFDAFHSDAKRWRRFHVSWLDCPHLTDVPAKKAELQSQIKRFGEDHPLVRSMIYGLFTQSGSNMVYDLEKVERAMSDLLPKYGSGFRRAAVDLSGGGDETCLYVSNGNSAHMVGSWHEKDATILALKLISAFQREGLKPEWIYADEGGLGDPILDQLASNGWSLNRVNFAAEPSQPGYFANLRAEMHVELSNRIKRGEVRLQRDDRLKEQFGWHQFKLTDLGKIQLLPKKDMPSSPDRADTVAMLFYEFPLPESFVGVEAKVDMKHSPTRQVVDEDGIGGGYLFES